MGKGKGKVGSKPNKANDVCIHCRENGHWKRECPKLLSSAGTFVIEVNMITNSASWVLDTGYGAHICNDLQVLERSRKLSRDEVVLKLGDGKVVAAEVVGHDLIMTAQNKRKMDNQDNAQIWHARLGHISQDRIKRFKEFRLEVENQTGRKIKTLRSDQGGEYLSGEFLDYLKENGILSQWTPPGTPQLNGVSERRNRTLLDMVRSMMSFTELPLSFWGYALETAAKLLNMAPSKTVAQTPYQIWHGKPASYKYLRLWGNPAYVKRLVGDKLDSRSSLCRFVGYPKETTGYYFYDPSEQKVFVSRNAVFLEKGFPADTRREELLLEESKEATPQIDAVTSSAPIVPTNDILILRRSTRVSQQPERYGFLGLTGQLDNDPKTYGEVMSDIDSEKWIEAMKSEMDSMNSNKVWTLVDPPKGVKPVGCKWVYKRKLGADGEVTTYKARLVAKRLHSKTWGRL
ncbi:UNVERIFIED_CONTAM: Retrovirus-related Pol polyprotein from transposon TNT 1-94 [Sesamum radiatum]|uniref:Retrovirus-related Pol polyprotein from transposon TNT 1-94 n=1 Tax=Sesamum radiatum TaxID=300843 RepID=A0AAW2JEU1_SESRA